VISDEELVSAAKSASRDAFAELWNRHAPTLYRLVYRVLNSHEDTEDALQESFFKAYLHIAEFKGNAKFSTWLARIAINTALGELRRRRSRPAFAVAWTHDDDVLRYVDIADKRIDIEKAYELVDAQQRLRKAMTRLRPDQRRLLELKHTHDYSNRELAALVGMSVPSVKSVLHRANKSLRGFCGRAWSQPDNKRFLKGQPKERTNV